MKGKKRVNIDREFIFRSISPFDIFRFYYPYDFELNRHCINPFVARDENPSMIIGNKSDSGDVIFKCFNSSNRGDCFNFVMQLYNLTYSEAINRIAKDFGLIAGSLVDYKKIISQYDQPDRVVKPMFIQAKTKKITEREIAYLAKFHLTIKDMNFCKDTKTYSIGEWAINRMRQSKRVDEICLGYNLVNERGNWIKIYRPEEDKKFKWRSSIPFTELHGVGNIHDCEIGILTKSMKDAAVIAKFLTPHVEVVQAEDSAAISNENIIRLKESCKELYISFDSDEKGCQASIELTNEIGCKYINPPKELLKFGITDWSDMIKYYDSHIPLVEFWKQKNVLE